MSVRGDVEQAFAERVKDDPILSNIGKGQGNVSGEVNETLQALTDAFMTLADGLLVGLLRVADSVDDLRENRSTN